MGVKVEEGVVLDANEVVRGGWTAAVVMLVLIIMEEEGRLTLLCLQTGSFGGML